MDNLPMVEIVIKEDYKSLYENETYFSGYLDEELPGYICLTMLTNGRHFMSFSKNHIEKIFGMKVEGLC